MAIDLPPSRYRVIERGRRLEVIDTQAQARTPHYEPQAESAQAPPPDYAPMPPEPVAADQFVASSPAFPSALDPVPTAQPPLAAQRMIAAPPDPIGEVASTVMGNDRDADGRLILTTSRSFDAKGPRRIALDPDGQREVGLAVLGLIVASVVGLIVAVTTGWFGFAIVVVFIVSLRQVRTAATPWLDRLEARSR